MSHAVDIALIGGAHPHVDYVLDEVTRRADVRIVAVADSDPQRRAMLADRTGAVAYADHHALLSRHPIAAAAVVTEFGARASIVSDLVARDIFAIVDKPLAVTEAQLGDITQALAGRERIALLLEKRFYPVTLALRDIIASGALGEIVTITATGPHKLFPARRPAWMFDLQLYGGILADLTVHDIDLALWLTGARRGSVSGWISPTSAAGTAAFNAAGRAILTCDSGLQIVVDVDWIQPEAAARHGDYAMRVCGTRGRADALFAEDRLVVETATRARFDATLPDGEPPARFALDHVANGRSLAIPTADALRATRIAIRAQQSAQANGDRLDWS